MSSLSKIKQFTTAVLRQTKRIPENLVTDELVVELEYGLVYPKIRGLSKEDTRSVFDYALPNLLNFQNTFHKSWQKIAQTDQIDLWKDAALHYFTTYGLESLGIDNSDYIYLPDEIDSTPELRKFRVISTIASDQLIKDTTSVLDSGVALSQATIEDYYTILDGLMFAYDFAHCKNREARTIFAARSQTIPDNGEDIVRILNFLITKNTLLIKNRDTFYQFQSAKYALSQEEYDYVKTLLVTCSKLCASVFYRYKPLFIALRHAGFQPEINQIRRLAKKYWVPHHPTPLLSTQILDGSANLDQLDLLSNFDLVKIYNKLAFLTYVCAEKGSTFHELIIVRNGKLFINPTQDFLSNRKIANANLAKDKIKNLLVQRLDPDHKRRIVLPKDLELAFPTSEKTFIGDIPLYSRAICSQSSVIGIAWEKDDLDLSAILEDQGKIGWNSSYKTPNQDILYSGDMTRGGAEAIYFGSPHSALIMMNVYYGRIPEVNLFISNEKKFNLSSKTEGDHQQRSYIYDPNNIVYSAKLAVDGTSQILGLYDKLYDSTVFTFVNLSLGYGPVSQGGELTSIAMSTLRDRGASCLKLSDIFRQISPTTYKRELKRASEAKDQSKLSRLESHVTDLTDLNKTALLNLINPT